MPLYLLDRDGVLVVNCPTNVKTPGDIRLIPGAAAAISRLSAAGYTVGMCTNQPEVGRGIMSKAQLDDVHEALKAMVAREGGRLDFILCATGLRKTPGRKPAGGMLKEALLRYGASAADTSFVGDQPGDLKAAFHAGCRRVLVRTGLGAKSVGTAARSYAPPHEIYDDLAAAVQAELAR